jgi:hypothetical protein
MTVNPFQSAVDNNINFEHMRALALIVRCAHTESDVFTGCRVYRALSDYTEPSINGYLEGCHFEAWVDDGMIPYLDALQGKADEFLTSHVETQHHTQIDR